MSLISNLPPIGALAGAQPNVQPQALATVTAAASNSPTAQLLLSNAVVAAARLPDPSPEQKRPDKPVLRVVTAGGASSLAAQLIAQDPEVTDEQLAVFAPQTTPEVSGAPAGTNMPQNAGSWPLPQGGLTAATGSALPSGSQTVTANGAAALPQAAVAEQLSLPLPLVKEKRVNLAHARGASAYGAAAKRVDTQRVTREVPPVAL